MLARPSFMGHPLPSSIFSIIINHLIIIIIIIILILIIPQGATSTRGTPPRTSGGDTPSPCLRLSGANQSRG
jgi:hypothetical protein